jgi:hypothetical protein
MNVLGLVQAATHFCLNICSVGAILSPEQKKADE